MKKIALGALLVLGLAAGTAAPVFAAPGDGLDRDAAAQGNGRFGNMHSGAEMGSRSAMMPGGAMRRPHHHRRHRRHHR
ncbi:hypothetical protein [Methylobacterium sp. J-076]|uniref:hypothetical protein n=1 Tax=Methylobacterium sp. J-076 TaxID=2836655 RepID=UPI001FBA79FB|nr:hypothetical protein [Methylobacterium sp. J-076]MCJ2011726.1 hypothetical protein [Methylobacterium sp. J-076]